MKTQIVLVSMFLACVSSVACQAGRELERTPTCVVEVHGTATQYQPLVVKCTFSGVESTGARLIKCRVHWQKLGEANIWREPAAVQPSISEDGKAAWDIGPYSLGATGSSVAYGCLSDPRMLGWSGRYRLRVIAEFAADAPLVGIAPPVVSQTASEFVELDVAPYAGAGASSMQASRDTNGELWRGYKRLMDAGWAIDGLFRTATRVNESSTQVMRSALQQNAAARGQGVSATDLDILNGELANWVAGAGNQLEYKMCLIRGSLLLQDARMRSADSENLAASAISPGVEARVQQAETLLATALLRASLPNERLRVMVCQMRVAELRGRQAERSALRAAIMMHPKFSELNRNVSTSGYVGGYIERGSIQ